MLAVNKFPQTYIDGCRSKVDAQISAYKDVVTAAKDLDRSGGTRLDPEIEAFEPVFFNNMVLLLDYYFVHRTRTLEKKDGNPLNEVRVLCDSMLTNVGIMAADKTIRLDPAKSLLGYQVGDKIKLNEGDFLLLSKAFFAEIENKYT